MADPFLNFLNNLNEDDGDDMAHREALVPPPEAPSHATFQEMCEWRAGVVAWIAAEVPRMVKVDVERAREAEKRAREAEKRAREAEAKVEELQEKVEQLQKRAREADAFYIFDAQQMEARHQEALDRAYAEGYSKARYSAPPPPPLPPPPLPPPPPALAARPARRPYDGYAQCFWEFDHVPPPPLPPPPPPPPPENEQTDPPPPQPSAVSPSPTRRHKPIVWQVDHQRRKDLNELVRQASDMSIQD